LALTPRTTAQNADAQHPRSFYNLPLLHLTPLPHATHAHHTHFTHARIRHAPHTGLLTDVTPAGQAVAAGTTTGGGDAACAAEKGGRTWDRATALHRVTWVRGLAPPRWRACHRVPAILRLPALFISLTVGAAYRHLPFSTYLSAYHALPSACASTSSPRVPIFSSFSDHRLRHLSHTYATH